jgi:spore coat polysaccharide biosynthesis protein SpsF (cytidylyltransferase family)
LTSKATIPLIVQARTQSTRYPGKVLQPFAQGLTLLEFQLSHLKKAFPESPIVVATSSARADEAVAKAAENTGVLSYQGDEQDVLKRFLDCCGHFGFTGGIVRICGDNPFLQTELLTNLLNEAAGIQEACDYISYTVGHIPAIRTHFGFFGEWVTVEALGKVYESTEDPIFHEHVTNYIYESAGLFNIRWLEFAELIPYLDTLRLTIDSREDFENAQYILGHLPYPDGPTGLSWREILHFVEKTPAARDRMAKQIRLYVK